MPAIAAKPDEPELEIPLNVPSLLGNEWKYVQECLDTNWVSYAGPFVDRFEKELAVAASSKYAVATNSGTSALHVALILAGVEPDTEVLMPDLSFVAPANAVRYCGAWPTLMDVSLQDWQLDIEKLAMFLEKETIIRGDALVNKHTKRRISAIMPVHLLGGLADVDTIGRLASKYNLPVVEDAAESLGATYKDRAIGAPSAEIDSSRRIVTTSFNGNKIITTGGGGAILVNCEALAKRAKHLTTTAKLPGLGFYHDEVGYNYRLTNLAAAIGVAQLERLADHVVRKREMAERYYASLSVNSRIATHPEGKSCHSTFWLYTVMLDRPSGGVIEAMNQAGIQSRPLWHPMGRLPAFRDQAYSYHCEATQALYQRGVCLPSSVDLTPNEQQRVIQVLQDKLNCDT